MVTDHQNAPLSKSGFSFIELLAVTSALFVVAATVVPAISNFIGRSEDVKLDQDIKVLNSAAGAYLTFGGHLDEDDTAATVVQKLKTRAVVAAAEEVTGLSGQFIDPRIEIVMQNTLEADTDMKRALWDAESAKFVLATGGGKGIKRVQFSDNDVPLEGVEEERETLMGKLVPTAIVGLGFPGSAKSVPTDLTEVDTAGDTSFAPPSVVVATGSPGYNPTDPLNKRLLKPVFSVPEGDYTITDFEFPVSINNPNPLGSSTVVYTVDGGGWDPYNGGTVSVSAPTTLRARAIPLDPHPRPHESYWIQSKVANALYDGIHDSGFLDPPTIGFSAPQFITGPVETVTVTLSNPNPEEISRLDFRLNGSNWQTYTGPFPVSQAYFPEGISVEVETYAVSTSVYWVDSESASATIIPSPPGEAPFAIFCSDRNPLKEYGVTILDGGSYESSSQDAGVDGNVAIGPGANLNLSNGSVTGEFRTHPGTSGSLSGADDKFGNGGDPVVPVITDLSTVQQEAMDTATAAAGFPATETYGKIGGNMTLTASDPNGLTVINIEEVVLKGGNLLTISGGADDFMILNISDRVKMTGGATWRVTGGIKVSQVIFNMAPGADFVGSGGSGEITGAVILAPHPGSDVTITGSSIVRGAVVCGGTFKTTGGAQLFPAACGL